MSKGITSLGMTILIATVIVIILVGTYATITFTNEGENLTCSESTATFAVLQNVTTTYVSYPIPAEPCQHHISLTGFSLNITSGTSLIALSGFVHVTSPSQLNGLIMYLDGTYEQYSPMTQIRATSYSFQYNTVLGNGTVPVTSGMNYTLEFVAVFKDGTATTASLTLKASQSN